RPVRRLPGVGIRPRRRPRGLGGLPRCLSEGRCQAPCFGGHLGHAQAAIYCVVGRSSMTNTSLSLRLVAHPPGRARVVALRGWQTMTERIAVAKTYKLYIGGAFPRSESGRSYPVNDSRGRFLANAALASRKDVRDAVSAARKAFPGWSGATAYNRGQVLYRVAELPEGRREQFVAEVAAAEGVQAKRAQSLVDSAIDRWVWYA